MAIQKVLVADGSKKARKNTIRSLKEIGVDATEATDGKQALSLFREGAFDAVFTDLNISDDGGLEVVRQIRKSNPNMPIILTANVAENGRALEASQAGASHFLVKPFTAQILREKLDQQISA